MPNDSNLFVTEVDTAIAPKMKKQLQEQGFTLTAPQYTLFSAKKKGVSCTLYQSGKLVVQGKEASAFIEFYLEPEVLKELVFTKKKQGIQTNSATSHPHIGIDESGKGDFFGPLCIAGVHADEEQMSALTKLGIQDSKNLTDKMIHKLAKEIKRLCPHHSIRIGPRRYNELYAQFRNLNSLLAWGHAQTIEELVNQTRCRAVLIDQFANERVVEKALENRGLKVDLTQRHRGEEDVVVAAASILARDCFVTGLEKLGAEFNITLPKGASSATISAGRRFVLEYGVEALADVCKMHFKTLDSIID